MAVAIRVGRAADVEAAAAVYERSSRARHGGRWPSPGERRARVRTHLLDRATWFLVAAEPDEPVAMASVAPLRGDAGAGAIIPGACLLAYLYVAPERWGEGIGGAMLDAVLGHAERHGNTRMHLWTHHGNERARRLYGGRGFSPTGHTTTDAEEWARTLGSDRPRGRDVG